MSENDSRKSAGPGRKSTDQELAGLPDLLRASPLPRLETSQAPLAKAAAALPTCRVTFSYSGSLATIPDQAYMGYAIRGYYQQPCNVSYTVNSAPVNGVAYRLIPEASGWCPGSAPKIGYYTSSGTCINQTQGKYWGRRLGNDLANDGVAFNAADATHYKDFDLKALQVVSGTVDVVGFTPGGRVTWSGLTAGNTWVFPAGTRVGQAIIYATDRNSRFLVDNLDVAIHP